MSLRVLVCDDEPIAVGRMTSLLGRLPDVEVVGTAMDGAAALAAFRSSGADLILLDIEMPGLDGFDVVRELSDMHGDQAPLITFVTAFRRFAPEAFDSGVVDFLSKPVRLARLETSVERARRLIASRQAEARLVQLEQKVATLRHAGDEDAKTHVWVHRRGEVLRVNLEDVERISAEGPYVRLHLPDRSYLHREPIASIQRRLDPRRYVRVHRSHLVGVAHVSAIRRTFHGGSELILRNGERIPVGRSHAKQVRRSIFPERPAE